MNELDDSHQNSEIDDLVGQAVEGDENALAELFSRYKTQLRGMIEFRMDNNLKGRVDPSDILQEAYVDLAKTITRVWPERHVVFCVASFGYQRASFKNSS